jgi:ABC-type polysaccharide transport system permease subunit
LYALKGTLSLLLQIPFFMAAYHFLSHLQILSGAAFGPIRDLAAEDGLTRIGSAQINLLPILMTAINGVSSAIYTKGFTLKQKLQPYVLAAVFLVLLYRSPSGLVLYWTMNNVCSLGKNIFMNDGLINDLLRRIGITGPEWLTNTTFSLPAVITMNCWVGIPFNMLLLISGLSSIENEVYESAMIDGANWGQRFTFITLPLMKSSILAVLMLGFIYTFRAFDLMYIMTKGGPLNSTDVLGTYSYMLSFTQFKFSKGSAATMVLFFCLFVVGMFYLHLLRKEDK